MHIPHTQLSFAALRAVVEELVTRDGTDHSAVERRIVEVLRQLEAGQLELHFDGETRTCNILPVGKAPFAASHLQLRKCSANQSETFTLAVRSL